VARLAPLRLRHHVTRTSRSSRPSTASTRRQAGHRRPQDQAPRHFSSGHFHANGACARRAGQHPAQMDAAARTCRHDRPRRAHPAPPPARGPRASDPPRPRLDTAPPRPLALEGRLHPRPEQDPCAPRRLTAAAITDDDSIGHRPGPARARLPAATPNSAATSATEPGHPQSSRRQPRTTSKPPHTRSHVT
jgi:hypothetical protein